jgi:hypothetical protein
MPAMRMCASLGSVRLDSACCLADSSYAVGLPAAGDGLTLEYVVGAFLGGVARGTAGVIFRGASVEGFTSREESEARFECE